MAMGKKRWRQQPMWIANQELPRSRGHAFYDRVNERLIHICGASYRSACCS